MSKYLYFYIYSWNSILQVDIKTIIILLFFLPFHRFSDTRQEFAKLVPVRQSPIVFQLQNNAISDLTRERLVHCYFWTLKTWYARPSNTSFFGFLSINWNFLQIIYTTTWRSIDINWLQISDEIFNYIFSMYNSINTNISQTLYPLDKKLLQFLLNLKFIFLSFLFLPSSFSFKKKNFYIIFNYNLSLKLKEERLFKNKSGSRNLKLSLTRMINLKRKVFRLLNEWNSPSD